MTQPAIAHVLSSFGTGGQERVALDLARLQRTAGHRVVALSLAYGPDGPMAEAFQAAGIATETVGKRGPSLDPSLPLRLAKALRRHRVELVHTHNPHALIYGALAARLVSAAAVHTKHGINPANQRRQWLRRGAARLVDAYVAVTQSLARIALDNAECAKDRLHVIPNGIDVRRFSPNVEQGRKVRAELGIPEDAWVVGTVGRLAPEKNQSLLVRAIAPMLDQHRHLVIVGDGPERETLAAQIEQTYRSEFVHLTGARDDIGALLAAFDVFALTSRSEGLPLVLLEAMAAELPIVATAVGGVPDLVEHGVTGYLVEPDDCPALTKQLIWLSTRPYDAQQVAGLARSIVLNRHSTDRMTQAYGDLYSRVVTRGGRARAKLAV